MTGLQIYQNNEPTFNGLVRDGVQGNLDVLWRMIDIVRNTVILDKGFEDFVKQLEHDSGLNAYSDPEKIFTFFYDFIKKHISYIPDKEGKTESIKDARTTLRDEYGDCDDLSILSASILAVLGYEPFFVISKYPESNNFTHVYTAVYVKGKRYVFDNAFPEGSLNSEAEMDKQEFGVFDDTPQTKGFVATVRNAKYVLLEAQSNLKSLTPLFSSFLPFGFLGNNIIRKSLFGDVNKAESLSELGSAVGGHLHSIIVELQNGRIPLRNAQSEAHSVYAQLYAYPAHDSDEFRMIDKKLKAKVYYIDHFTEISNIQKSVTGTSYQKYLMYGLFGIGVYYLLKD